MLALQQEREAVEDFRCKMVDSFSLSSCLHKLVSAGESTNRAFELLRLETHETLQIGRLCTVSRLETPMCHKVQTSCTLPLLENKLNMFSWPGVKQGSRSRKTSTLFLEWFLHAFNHLVSFLQTHGLRGCGFLSF